MCPHAVCGVGLGYFCTLSTVSPGQVVQNPCAIFWMNVLSGGLPAVLWRHSIEAGAVRSSHALATIAFSSSTLGNLQALAAVASKLTLGSLSTLGRSAVPLGGFRLMQMRQMSRLDLCILQPRPFLFRPLW